MNISSLEAGRTLCELSGWTVTCLNLQKILYFAHMIHLGKTDGAPLVSDHFEAWMYGPVAPKLYRRVKIYGTEPVGDVFWEKSVPEGSLAYEILDETMTAMKDLSGGQLISLTHWEHGAWAEVYEGGQGGIPIPNALILEEYRARQRQKNASP